MLTFLLIIITIVLLFFVYQVYRYLSNFAEKTYSMEHNSMMQDTLDSRKEWSTRKLKYDADHAEREFKRYHF